VADFPRPTGGIVLTHFIVSDDVERSRRFYTEVLGGESVYEGEPSIVQLANAWVIINVGGGHGGQADGHPRGPDRPRPRQQLRRRGVHPAHLRERRRRGRA
jgi:catechol 2,3-dioxygenase-like lactoylglutathione lyase family enzyme